MLQQAERLAAIRLQKERRAAASKVRREEDQEILRQAQQYRLEQRRLREQAEDVRAEQSRLNGLAIIEQAQELWRFKDEERAVKHREQKRLRDEAGIRARGPCKQPVAYQPATEPCAKRRLVLVGVDNRRSR